MSVGPALLPIFQQLGIYEEFLTIAKPFTYAAAYRESLSPYKRSDYRPVEEFAGYGQYIVSRPKLYDLLLKQVPSQKIHFGKRVLKIFQDDDDVIVIQTNDKKFHEGDIVVGADGAYSAVRQRMYEVLKAEGTLPESDQEELPFSCTCLVGQTKVLDPEKFPILKETSSEFRSVFAGDRQFQWTIFTTAQNTICWMVIHILNEITSKAAMEQRFRSNDNSEWGVVPALAMVKETRHFPIALEKGKKHTMGDLYDLTMKEHISKVMLEEKTFQTWHSGRTVLMGDACHKLNPCGGLGAVTAMHDAVALANLFYAMPTNSSQEVTKAFEEYQAERFPAVMDSYKYSQFMGRLLGGGMKGTVFLLLITRMPMWLWRLVLQKTCRYRPQVGFLEPIPLMGTVAPAPSPSADKARAAYEKQNQVAAPV
ncbi:hypothetical protein BGX29_012157 [Mortierella sp. GBA35]|nr:hypothetical protein BGX29_012157 [Mortierella sp. GBA35]KAG0199467.1 hypothetical protein BGX33_011624 [Mortierella sp. NVP41]